MGLPCVDVVITKQHHQQQGNRPMTDTNKSHSPLRQRMIEDMAMRQLAAATQRGYLRAVERFTRFFGASPDTAEAEDLRRFQLHMANAGASSTTINQTLTGLRFFYRTTVSRPDVLAKVSSVHEPEKLPMILSMEEVARRECLKFCVCER